MIYACSKSKYTWLWEKPSEKVGRSNDASTHHHSINSVSIGADFPDARGANAPIGKGSVGACTQRKNWWIDYLSGIFFSFNPVRFSPVRRYASVGLCDSNVSIRPSVCPSRAGIVSKRMSIQLIQSWFLHLGSPSVLVFWWQISSRRSKGFPERGRQTRDGGWNQQFSIFKPEYLENSSRYG